MESGGGKEGEVAGIQDHAAGLPCGHDADGAHFRGEIDEGDPGGEHL